MAESSADMHGFGAFSKYQSIKADVAIEFEKQPPFVATMIHDVRANRTRINTRDGAQLVVNDKHISVWPGDAAVDGPASQMHLWPYLLIAPLTFREAGCEALMHDYGGSSWNMIVTYGPPRTRFSGDWFYCMIDVANNYRLAAMATSVRLGGEAQSDHRSLHAVEFSNFKKIQGVTVAHRWTFRNWSAELGFHGEPLGHATISNVKWGDVDDVVFDSPDDARVIRQTHAVEDGLRGFQTNEREEVVLEVSCDDGLLFFGGLQVAVDGNGRVAHKFTRVGQQPPPPPRHFTREELRELIELLLEIEAWHQAAPIPMHGACDTYLTLRIKIGNAKSVIAEPIEDCKRLNRIQRVYDFMQRTAWSPAAADQQTRAR